MPTQIHLVKQEGTRLQSVVRGRQIPGSPTNILVGNSDAGKKHAIPCGNIVAVLRHDSTRVPNQKMHENYTEYL